MNKLIVISITLAAIFVFALIMPGITQAQYYTGLCTYHSYERCSGNYLYWYDSCGNQDEIAQYCANGCYNNFCQNDYNYNYNYNDYCTSNYQQRCAGNNIYWYDSCGNQENFVQYCPNGCDGNFCQNSYNNYNNYNYNYNNYNTCTYHAYKLCQGNNVYWYDSCGTQQDLYSSCGGGQVCQYGQCANSYVQPSSNYTQPVNNYKKPASNGYVAHYNTSCYGNSLYWYNSSGSFNGIYKSCVDTNSCTLDSCYGDKCLNTLKCDGSTCATNSADYAKYCQAGQGNVTPTPVPTQTPAQPTPTPAQPTPAPNTQSNTLSTSLFVKESSSSNQWQKTAGVGSNSQVYFMISATNTSTAQIDNVMVSANIPTEISSLGNLQVNGVMISGDIISGINIGSVAPSTTKLVTFTGKTGALSASSAKQAVATSTVSGKIQTDSVTINLNPNQPAANQTAAAVSNTPATTGFWAFFKRWYLWVLGALVLIFLFVVVFRRFSSDV